MKRLKKYISIAAAVALMGIYTAVPVYAENDDIEFPETLTEEDEVVEVEDSEEEEPDEIIPIEDEDDPDVDVEDNVQDPDVEIVGIDTPEDDEPDLTDDTPAVTQPAQTAAAQPAEATPQYNAVSPYTMYSKEVVNVRYGPDTSYSKLGTVYANSPVTVVGTAGGWLVIEYNGTKGFVSSSFFSDSAPETTTTAAAQAAPAEAAEQTEASETTAEPQQAEIVDDTTTKETKAPETEPQETEAPDENAETTTSTETDDDKEAAAASTDSGNKSGGLGGVFLAIACAVGTFLLIGVLPVIIHSIYHKKLYQY